MKTIMAVGAHTGDAQLTSGLLLARHAQEGDRIVTLDLTAGERGTPAGFTQESFRQYNIECAGQFAQMLGGKSIVLDIPDGELTYSQELASASATSCASTRSQPCSTTGRTPCTRTTSQPAN